MFPARASPEVLVLPRLMAEALEGDDQTVCVSITNPRQAPAVLTGYTAVLRLGFHDAMQPSTNFQVLEREQARELVDFAHRHRRVRRFVVHCEHGVSRSAAVGLFIAQWQGRALSARAAVIPNPWVWAQLRAALNDAVLSSPWRWREPHRVAQPSLAFKVLS